MFKKPARLLQSSFTLQAKVCFRNVLAACRIYFDSRWLLCGFLVFTDGIYFNSYSRFLCGLTLSPSLLMVFILLHRLPRHKCFFFKKIFCSLAHKPFCTTHNHIGPRQQKWDVLFLLLTTVTVRSL